MSARFAVLGAGAWGTAVAIHLAKSGHEVRLWVPRAEHAAPLIEQRENARLLPGVRIPHEVVVTTDPGEATRDAPTWVVATPTAFLRQTIRRCVPFVQPTTRCVSLTKGIENETFLRPSEMITAELGPRVVAALSGPSHAEEVARGLPTSVVVGCTDLTFAAEVQSHFGNERFRIYTNRDLIGVELGGALKNVLGIAAGTCDGLAFGDNAKSALLTRSIVEMTRFGVAHGAEATTFSGHAGIGDLMTTCFSKHGRNRRVGERLGRGEKLADILQGPHVAEGVYTAKSVRQRCEKLRVEAPIMSAVFDVLYAGKSPLAAVQELMTRQMREEW